MWSNPAELVYDKYTEPYEKLSKSDKALEKLKHSEIYKNWLLAQKYGPQLYNHLFHSYDNEVIR